MDKLPADAPMENPPPLAGLNPADLLAQGAADDTIGSPYAFQPPTLEEMAVIFPQFEILELIGKGGMGAVYKVRQRELDRIVALKILPPAIGESPAFSNRFTREAKALAKLNHPGIVTLHEFGQADGLYFILMEFVDGVNLAQLMRTGRISPREALAIVPQICDALQFAHDQGIVHRDIKPENILLDRHGRVKVADFGIAKVVASICEDPVRSGKIPVPTDQTLAGNLMGTPQYMAPEQIDHPADVDHRADIYALGVVFYQMLTGELPGKNLQAPSRKVQIDVRLDEIVLKAMEKKPEQRYQQASVMKTRVESFEEDNSNKRETASSLNHKVSPSAAMPRGETRTRAHDSFRSWMFFIIMMIVVPALIFFIPVKDPLLGALVVAYIILHYRLKRSCKKVTMIVIASLFLGSLIVWDRLRIPASLQEAQKSAETVDHISKGAPDSSFPEAKSMKSDTPQSEIPNRAEEPPAEAAAEPPSKAEEFVELEIQAIKARTALLENDPARKQAEENLAKFIAARPEFPNDASRKVATQRRADLAVKITELAKQYGPGHAEILQLNQQIDSLNQLTEIGEKEISHKTAEVVLADDLPKQNRLQLRRVAPDDPNAELMEMEVTTDGNEIRKQELRVSREVIVWDKHIERTSIVSEKDDHRLDITLDTVGGERMGEATAGDPGRIRLAIIVDGRITSAPVVQNQLGRRFQISGLRSKEEALELLRSFPSWERQIQAAEAQLWLMLIDGEKFEESYDAASEFFRNALTKEQWAAMLTQSRKPLGQGVPPRKIKQVDEVQSLPGAPDGEYRVIQFETQFPNKNDSLETVTFMREDDGVWRAIGYFIR